MINLDTIDQEILDLEKKDTTYAVVERLAWLYIVRDHLVATEKATTGELAGSEFCRVCSNVPVDQLMGILSDHFDAVRAIYPREYGLLIDRIGSLS